MQQSYPRVLENKRAQTLRRWVVNATCDDGAAILEPSSGTADNCTRVVQLIRYGHEEVTQDSRPYVNVSSPKRHYSSSASDRGQACSQEKTLDDESGPGRACATRGGG